MISALLCLDPHRTATEAEMRLSLLKQFFAFVTEPRINERFEQGLDPCRWADGLRCGASLEIYSIQYRQYRHGNFAIQFIPPTVHSAMIDDCDQGYPLETRLLPKAIGSFGLPRNRIYGTVELRTLPPRLRSLNLMQNAIRGPIYLANLPETLEYIWLSGNLIEQDVLLYEALPASIVNICLNGQRHHIGSFWLVDSSGTYIQKSRKGVMQDRIEYKP